MDIDNLSPEEGTATESATTPSNQPEGPPPTPNMDALLQQEDLSLDFPRQGEIREGFIVSISENEILVSVGTKSEGVIPTREIEQLPPAEREKFQIGQQVNVYVVTPEDQQGSLLLSYVRALEEDDWQRAERHHASGDVYEGKIEGYNKGGLIVPMGMLRGFIPSSQISLARRMAFSGKNPEQRWAKMIGEPIATRVIEVDRSRRRLILSERAALQEARELLKERLLEELEVGQVRKGRVTSLADFGAFVNINGADGLVHLTEISWDRINHPNEVLKVGQEVEVKVIEIDQERKRIGLSIRQLQEDPWPQKVASIKVGQLVEGTVVRLVKFGAFARLENLDIEGLIHISELSEQRIEHPKEVIHEGDVLTLRVINIDIERHRIGLSLRKVDSPAYADLDWELALAEASDKLEEGQPTADDELVAEKAHPEDAPPQEISLEIIEDELEPEATTAITDAKEVPATAETQELLATTEVEEIPAASEAEEISGIIEMGEVTAAAESEELLASAEAEEIPAASEAEEIPGIIEMGEVTAAAESEELLTSAEAEEIPAASEAEEISSIIDMGEVTAAAESEELLAITEVEETPADSEANEVPAAIETGEVVAATETEELLDVTEADEISATSDVEEISAASETEEPVIAAGVEGSPDASEGDTNPSFAEEDVSTNI